MARIPQFRPFVGKDEYSEIAGCFENNWITEGPKSAEFLERLLKLTGASHGVFAPNGTLAIYLALIAAGIKPGDEVIVPDFTFMGSASAVVMAGGVPVFCDVNRHDLQIDPNSAERVVSAKTRFVMPVHVYGTCCQMQEILDFADAYNLAIVEDAAQAIGVKENNLHAGTFGKVGTFSFFADKTITTGEGGLIVTNDSKVHEELLYLRNQGRLNRGSFIHPRIGYNFRMTDMQAAVGLAQLAKLDEIKERKAQIWSLYKKLLAGVSGVEFFSPNPKANFIPFRVAIRSERREHIEQSMSSAGIETRSFFYPLRKQPSLKGFRSDHKNFYESDKAYETGICLPSFPSIKDSEIREICEVITLALD